MQTTKADETREDLSYKLYEHMQRVNGRNRGPAPLIRAKVV
jgi:hypothetical protein